MLSIGSIIVTPPREVIVTPPGGSWTGNVGVPMTEPGPVVGAAGLSVMSVTEAEMQATTIPKSKSRATTGLTTHRVSHHGGQLHRARQEN
jgi:hypothetical protein